MENREEEGVKALKEAFKEYKSYLPYLKQEADNGRWRGVRSNDIEVKYYGPQVFLCLTKRAGDLEFRFQVGKWRETLEQEKTIIFKDLHHGISVDFISGQRTELARKFLSFLYKELKVHIEVPIKKEQWRFYYDINSQSNLRSFMELIDLVMPLFNSFDFNYEEILPHHRYVPTNMQECNQYIEDKKKNFSENGYPILEECLSEIQQIINKNRWEKAKLFIYSFKKNGVCLSLQYGSLKFLISIEEDVTIPSSNYKFKLRTNLIKLKIDTRDNNSPIPIICFKTLLNCLDHEFRLDMLPIRDNCIELKDPTRFAVDIFIRICDIVYQLRDKSNYEGRLYLRKNKRQVNRDLADYLDLNNQINLLCLPLGIPIIKAVGKHKGMQFAIDPSKSHNYLFYSRVNEMGISLDDIDYIEMEAFNTNGYNEEGSAIMSDIIVSAKMRFEGQKVARKILFEVKDGYESYMEKAEKIAGTRLHGVLGLPYLAKHPHILKLTASLFDESVDGIISKSWCNEESLF